MKVFPFRFVCGFEMGFSEISYKGKVKDRVTFWVRLNGKDHDFSVCKSVLNDYDSALKSASSYLINRLDLNNLDHIKFKSYLNSL